MTVSRALDLPFLHQPADLAHELAHQGHVVGDDEALQRESPLHDGEHLRRPGHRRLVLVFRDRAAEGDAAEIVQPLEHGVEDPAADILEVGIDALRAELVQNGADIVLGLVVEAGVVARLAHRPGALVLAAGAADDLGAGELGELPRHLADRTGGRRHEHRLTCLGLADVPDAVPGGEGRHAQHAEMSRQGCGRGVDLAQALAVVERVARPVQQADHRVALGESRVLRLDHLADRTAGQWLVELEGRRVGAQLCHARPHVGIERQEARAHQHLALGRCRQARLLLAEAVGGHVARRALGEHDLDGVGHGSVLSTKSLRR